jgi:hypothetical protein
MMLLPATQYVPCMAQSAKCPILHFLGVLSRRWILLPAPVSKCPLPRLNHHILIQHSVIIIIDPEFEPFLVFHTMDVRLLMLSLSS